MSAELLAVDPVTAARRLLGATLYGRDVVATVVEVEHNPLKGGAMRLVYEADA